MMARQIIEAEIERLIDMLDRIDGDADLELEMDVGADDHGEPDGAVLLGLAA